MGQREDVARLAGVSARTVSNVVSGTVNVAAGTRERVLAAIEQTDSERERERELLARAALERRAQRDGGVSHGHFKLLVLLGAAEEQTLGLKHLADSLRFSQSRISHALAALERQGLVTHRSTVGGRRASEATLTDDGQRLVGRVLRAQRQEIRDPLFDDLGDVGTLALGDISARIITFLDSSARPALPDTRGPQR